MKTHEILDLFEADHSIMPDGNVEFELDLYDEKSDEHKLITLQARVRPGYVDFGDKSHQSDNEGGFESDLIVNRPFIFKGTKYPAGYEFSENLIPYVMIDNFGAPGSANLKNLGDLYDLLLMDVEESGKLDDFLQKVGAEAADERGDWEYNQRMDRQADGDDQHVTQ